MSPSTATSLLALASLPTAPESLPDLATPTPGALLSEARDLQPNGPTLAAVQGCLRSLIRLDLTVLQAHLLTSYVQRPEWTAEAFAEDLRLPKDTVLNGIAELFARRLILTPHEGRTLITQEGTIQAAVIIGCTSLAQAGNLLGRKPAVSVA